MAKFYISSGHSANDPGAVKYVVERDEVWEISNMVAEELRALGHIAYRDKWDYGWRDTVNEANRLGVHYFFEYHKNAGGGNGAEVIIHNNANQYIADMFKAAFAEVGQNWRRTIVDPTYWVLKYTNAKACIVEVAFVDNREDSKQFDEPYEKRRLAKIHARHMDKLARADGHGPENPSKPATKPSVPVKPTDTKPQKKNRTIADVYNPKVGLTAAQAIKAGQAISNIILGTDIAEDGIDGPDTQANRVRMLQWAMNKDYLVNIEVDGLVGPLTKSALGIHTVRQGEIQYMVTALEVLLLMNGYNPHGVELPGEFGSGLAQCLLRYQMDHSNLTNDRIAGRQTFLQLIK